LGDGHLRFEIKSASALNIVNQSSEDTDVFEFLSGHGCKQNAHFVFVGGFVLDAINNRW